MKFIRQELQFSWFFKRATTLYKISSGIKLGLRSNSANATSSSNLFLIFLNKIQLKIKIKIKINFFNWVGPGSMHLTLDWT